MPVSGVVLDANGLLIPFQFKVNLDRELDRLFGHVPVFVPSSVLGELARVTDVNSRAALALARKYQIVETELRGDDAVLELARARRAAILTNDRGLIKRAREASVPIVRLRSGRYLEADDF